MDSDSWLEPKTRIPFVGIIAMVLIVAVVAVFIKTQLAPLFPPSTVEVQSGNNAPALTGRATTSSSFIGLREIDLHRQERLQGVLTTTHGTLAFTADTAISMLTIDDGTHTEEAVLHAKENDPGALTATFEYNGVPTRIDIEQGNGIMLYSQPGKSVGAITLALGTVITYEGNFRFRNEQYRFAYSPASDSAQIIGKETANIPLTLNNNLYSGTWQDGRNSRPVTVDTKKVQAVIEDVY